MSPATGQTTPFHPARSSGDKPQPISRSRRMPTLFNTIRAAVYATVLVFTVICLGMAGHFQSVLAASDLTRFVPFAIFVCTASLFIFMVLILFSVFLRERNPISTRIELASLGLAGVFWLVLGVYLTTSESQDADVECFQPDTQFVLDPEISSFQTDQFQAMYRVLMAFALMNAALIIASALILLFLAFRRHRNGDKHVWHVPVTSGAWFNNYNYKTSEATYTEKPQRRRTGDTVRSLLPTHSNAAPAAAAGAGAGLAALAAAALPSRKHSSGRAPAKEAAPPPTAYTEKPERKGSRGSGRDPRRQDSTGSASRGGGADARRQNSGRSASDPRRQNSGTRREYRDLQQQQHNPYMAAYYQAPAAAGQGRSGRYAPSSPSAGSTQDFENGGMVNPARQGSYSRR